MNEIYLFAAPGLWKINEMNVIVMKINERGYSLMKTHE